MGPRDGTLILAASGHLALALLSTSRAGKNSLALPFALLAFDLFGFTFATFCHHQFGGLQWRVLDAFFTSLAPPLVLHVVLAFVGRLRARRAALRATYIGFGALGASCVAAFFSESANAWIESPSWAALFLAGWIPTFVGEIVLLVAHLRAGGDADEKARTRLVLAAVLVGGAFASTDLWSDVGVPVPGLAPLGTLVSTFLLAVVAVKFRLFDRNLGRTTALYAVSVALAVVLLYLTLFQGLVGNLPALTFGVTVVTLLVAALVREATISLSTSRERVERLAVLGRFSAQMAHDLKNPIAALVGAVQVLDHDAADAREFRALIVDQASRIRAILEQYERLGRVETFRSLVWINDLVKRVTGLSQHTATHKLTACLDLYSTLVAC